MCLRFNLSLIYGYNPRQLVLIIRMWKNKAPPQPPHNVFIKENFYADEDTMGRQNHRPAAANEPTKQLHVLRRQSYNEKLEKAAKDQFRHSFRAERNSFRAEQQPSKQERQDTGTKRFSDLKDPLKVAPGIRKNSCENHPSREGIFYMVYREEQILKSPSKKEIMRYCEECAINLSEMNFFIRRDASRALTPEQQALDQFFQCQRQLSDLIQQVKQTDEIKLIDAKIQQTQELFVQVQDALQRVKKQELMRLEVQKIQFHEAIWERVNNFECLKKKISYLISDVGASLKANKKPNPLKSEIFEGIYQDILAGAKSKLEKMNSEKVTFKIQKEQFLSKMQICDKVKEYLMERTHELSFEMEEEESKSQGINLLQLSNFEATFGNNSQIEKQELQTSRRQLAQQLRI